MSGVIAAVVVVATGHGPFAPAPGLAANDVQPLVRVTAVVSDRRGNLVPGLTASDFELFVDGAPQPIHSVEVAPAPAAPRAYGILLDEFHTAAADSAAVRAGLLHFFERQVRPQDLAFVVKPLDSLLAIRPTADRAAVRSAVEGFEGRKGDFAPRTLFERQYMAQAPNAVASARGQIVTSALRAIGAVLAQTDARGTIVLVSDGFERMRAGRDIPANLQATVRVANRADAPVYAFAPALSASPQNGTAPPDPAFAALHALTMQTGGLLVTGANELVPGLARMLRDLDRHYVLTYRAPHGRDGRFHALRVGVKRNEAEVRARNGYLVAGPALTTSVSNDAAPLRVLRRSPLIQSWSGIAPLDRGRVRVTFAWEPSVPRPGSTARTAAASLLIHASTPDGVTLFDGPVTAATAAAAPEAPNRAVFEAPAGTVRVDVKVLAARGVVIDTDARDVAMPRTRAGSPTIYPPAVTRVRSAREFRSALAAGAAPAASRDFRRTDRLLISVPAIDADGSPATVAGVLLNRSRQPMRELPAMSVPDAPPGVTHFELPLAGFAPGEYTLRLTVPQSRGSAAEHVTFRIIG